MSFFTNFARHPQIRDLLMPTAGLPGVLAIHSPGSDVASFLNSLVPRGRT